MKFVIKIFTLISFVLLSSFTILKNDLETTTIILDPGHGGFDSGSTKLNTIEKEFTLAIAQKIKEQNKNKNVNIILTREKDQYLDLIDRAKFINKRKPKFFISLHLNNASNEELNGYEIYHYPDDDEAEIIAEKFVYSFESPLKNRGVKNGNFYILRKAKVPGFIYEMGFISNDKDYEFLESDAGKQKIVDDINNFINSQ